MGEAKRYGRCKIFRENLTYEGTKTPCGGGEEEAVLLPLCRCIGRGTDVENKGISTGFKMRLESTIRFGHESAASDLLIPYKERNLVSHVEAHESASDPWPSGRTGAAHRIFDPNRASDGVE